MLDKYGFKFKIGDVVTTKVKADCKFMILDRILEECHAGIQRHYKVRAFVIRHDVLRREPDLTPATQVSTYNEIELELVP